jgi:transposase InsO family protein
MNENQLKRKLNNYIWSNDIIDSVKHFLTNHQIPDNLITNSQKNKFRDKYLHFAVQNGNLIYLPTDQIVVPNDDYEKNKIIGEIYKDYGLGSGIKNLFEKVSRRYINIKRKDVEEFLKRNTNYQLTKPQIKQTNKKIFSSDVNKIWGMDLIDLNTYVSKNKQYRYILTCVDFFSKFIMLAKIKKKDGPNVVSALREICMLKAGCAYPRSIISDNGLEFKNEEMTNFCNENNIKQIFGLSYSPKSNALTENANGIVRRCIRNIFVRNGNLNWCDHLDEIMKSINDTRAISTGKSRSDVFVNNKFRNEIREKINHEKQQLSNNEQKFAVGDYCRISLHAIQTDLRRKRKEGLQKYIVVNYSFEIFRIEKVYISHNKFLKDQYLVEDKDGNILHRRFFANELQKINPDTLIHNEKLNEQKIKQLNNVKIRDLNFPVNSHNNQVEDDDEDDYDIRYFDEPRNLRPRKR